MKIFKILIVLAVLLLSFAVVAHYYYHHHHRHHHQHRSEAVVHGGLVLKNIRIKAAMPGAKVTSGYLKIINKGEDNDRLISVAINGASQSEIHTMEIDGDIMRMRPLKDGIDLPKGAKVSLSPGGMHLMFMELDDFPKDGEMAELTLVFERAGEISLMAPVKKIKPRRDRHKKDHY